jgi:hypothetical protein
MSELRVVGEFRTSLMAVEPRRPRRPRWLLGGVGAIVVVTGIATAATGSFPIGDPLPARHDDPIDRIGAPVPSSTRLEPITAPDPDGGPPWGVRTYSTTERWTCVQIGRVVDGRLGIVGDDGAFHEAPPAGNVCYGNFHHSRTRAPDVVTTGGTVAPAIGDQYGHPPCRSQMTVRGTFDDRLVMCDGRPWRYVVTGTTGPRVVAVELVGPGVHERHPVSHRRFLYVRTAAPPRSTVTYAVYADGTRRRQPSGGYLGIPPTPLRPPLHRDAGVGTTPATTGVHGAVTVSLRVPPRPGRYGDPYYVELTGPSGCRYQEHLSLLLWSSRRDRAGDVMRFQLRPPGLTTASPRAWCAGDYGGRVVWRGRVDLGSFRFAVR